MGVVSGETKSQLQENTGKTEFCGGKKITKGLVFLYQVRLKMDPKGHKIDQRVLKLYENG